MAEKKPLQTPTEPPRDMELTGPIRLQKTKSENFKQIISGWVSNYKGLSKYDQWRSWIIISYSVLALFSIWMILPPLRVSSFFSLSVDVIAGQTSEGSLGFSIQNKSKTTWTYLRLTLDNQYEFYTAHPIAPSDMVQFDSRMFSRIGTPVGSSPPQKNSPFHALTVESNTGSKTVPLTP